MRVGLGVGCGLRMCVLAAMVAGGCGAGVGAVSAAGGSGTTAGSGQGQTIAEKIAASRDLLDINTATAAELRALPGMGDAYVQRVIAGRPYRAKNQLTTRGILPQGEYEEIKGLIVAHRVKK